MSAASRTELSVRVYGSLNDFLIPARRQLTVNVIVDRRPSVKDVLEGLGVPHPEIDLVIVGGVSVDFAYRVGDGDRVAAYPRFEQLDVLGLTRVRPAAPDPIRFVADVHLGRLARRLRLAGLDTVYLPDADDPALAGIAEREQRILLTRDRALLMRRRIARGYFIRDTDPQRQFVEVLRRYAPPALQPFTRCMRCNAQLEDVSKASVESRLQPLTRANYHEFTMCSGCGRVFWQGSHWDRLVRAVDAAWTEATGLERSRERR